MLTRARAFLARATAPLRASPPFLRAYAYRSRPSATPAAAGPVARLGNNACLRPFPAPFGALAAVAGKGQPTFAAPIRFGRPCAVHLRGAVSSFHIAAVPHASPRPAAGGAGAAAFVAAFTAAKEQLSAFFAEHLPFLKLVAKLSPPAAAHSVKRDRDLRLRFATGSPSTRAHAGPWPSSLGLRPCVRSSFFGPVTTRTSLGTSGFATSSVVFARVRATPVSTSFAGKNWPLRVFDDASRLAGVADCGPVGALENGGTLEGSAAGMPASPAATILSNSIHSKHARDFLSPPNFVIPAEISACPEVVYLSFLLYGSAAWDSVLLNASSANMPRGDDRPLSSSTVRNFADAVQMQIFHLKTVTRILDRLANTAAGQRLRVERRGCELRVLFPRGVPVAAIRRALLAAGVEPDSPHFSIECSLLAEAAEAPPKRELPRGRPLPESSSDVDDAPRSYRRGIEEFLSSVERYESLSPMASFSSAGRTTYDKALATLGALRRTAH